MSTERAIYTKKLCKSFGEKEVLHDCPLTVERRRVSFSLSTKIDNW